MDRVGRRRTIRKSQSRKSRSLRPACTGRGWPISCSTRRVRGTTAAARRRGSRCASFRRCTACSRSRGPRCPSPRRPSCYGSSATWRGTITARTPCSARERCPSWFDSCSGRIRRRGRRRCGLCIICAAVTRRRWSKPPSPGSRRISSPSRLPTCSTSSASRTNSARRRVPTAGARTGRGAGRAPRRRSSDSPRWRRRFCATWRRAREGREASSLDTTPSTRTSPSPAKSRARRLRPVYNSPRCARWPGG